MTARDERPAPVGRRPPELASVAALEVATLVGVQRLTGGGAARAGARGLSHVGEHALGWLVLAGAGAVLDAPRRDRWRRAGVAIFGAHAASVVLKRVARRRRPTDPRVAVLVRTPSAWSFPSSHATSTTTAALAFSGLTGSRLPLGLAGAMALSRMALGVHYPTDVLAGVALGTGFGVWARSAPGPPAGPGPRLGRGARASRKGAA